MRSRACVNLISGNGGFMTFGHLYPLTAIWVALPVTDVIDAPYGRANARVAARPTTACGADGVTAPPPPKNPSKQNTAL
jgi:hypothetical protein